MNPQDVAITFNLGTVLIYAFLGFLTILGTKAAIGVIILFTAPKLDGANAWGFLGVVLNMFSRVFLSLIAAAVVALIVASLGGSLVAALIPCAILGAVSIFVN